VKGGKGNGRSETILLGRLSEGTNRTNEGVPTIRDVWGRPSREKREKTFDDQLLLFIIRQEGKGNTKTQAFHKIPREAGQSLSVQRLWGGRTLMTLQRREKGSETSLQSQQTLNEGNFELKGRKGRKQV